MSAGSTVVRTDLAQGLRFTEVLATSVLAAIVLDADGRVAWCNDQTVRLVGRPRDELLGIRWIDEVVAPSDRDGAHCLFGEVVAGRTQSFQHETAVVRPDGMRRLVRWTTTLLRDGDGIRGIACVGEDVTDRRQAEQEHRLARAALDSSGTATAIGDQNGRVLYVNDAFLRLWGYARADEVLERSAFEFWTDPAAARAVVDGLLKDRRWIGELRARRADGRAAICAVHANLFSDPETGTVRMIGTFEDVTELRAAEERLRQAQRLARVGYWSLDLPSSALSWGEETYEILGVTKETFEGTQGAFLALVHPADRASVEAAFQRTLGTLEPVSMDFRAAPPGGPERVIHSEARPVLDASGRAIGLTGMVQDVTARVRLEEQLRQAQKMEAVGALAGGIAHDFNNLLTVILSLGSVALETLEPGHPARADLQEILATARRAEGLTRQILAFARRQFSRPVDLDLGATVAGAAKLIRRLIGEHIVVRLALPPDLPHVVADPRQLEQVLMNLAVNARDAMPSGGTLEFAARALPGEPARVELVVRDSGTGMDEAVRARAFDPFFTTKAPGHGTGLGLAVVHGIVQQCCGSIRIDSARGLGTAIVIELPAAPPAPAVPGAEAARAEAPRAAPGGTVLLVEDEPSVRAVAVRVLRDAGYRVLTAADGEEALRVAAGAPDLALLLTDVVMPGLGGAALAERLRAERPALRVLFMSGFTADLPKALAPNGGSLLHKPFTPDGLLARVAKAIAAR